MELLGRRGWGGCGGSGSLKGLDEGARPVEGLWDEVRPWELRQVHTSSATHRVNLGDRGKTTQVSATQRPQGKTHTSISLASFGQQCRAGLGSMSTGNDPRDK